MGKKRVVDKAIEPAEWRVTSAEQASGYNQAASIEVWGAVLRFVMEWQNVHEGESPTMFEIARNLGISGKSVRYHCGQMMLRGLIKYGPTGIQILGAGNALVAKPAEAQGPSEQTKEARVTTTERKTPTISFVERAKALAKFVRDFQQRYGISPTMKETADGLGYNSPSAVSALVRDMGHRGWIDHAPATKNCGTLTSLGMATLINGNVGNLREEDVQAAADHIERQEAAQAQEPVTIQMPWLDPKTVAEAMSRPAAITRISAEPDPHLSQVSDADLILELLDRGFMVTRQKR